MDRLTGIDVGEVPISGFEWELDLYGVDGPLLSQYKSDSGEKYLLYWCDCDETSERWLILPIAENLRVRLIAGLLSMREVIDSVTHNYVFFIDYNSTGAVQSVHLVGGAAIPGTYLPAVDSYISVDDPDEALGHQSASFLFNGNWEIEPVRDFIRSYKQAYNFTFGVLKNTIGGLAGLPWQGGFSAMHFYDRLKKQMGDDQASTQLIQFASPGILKLKVDDEVADAVLTLLERFKTNSNMIPQAYNELRAAIAAKSLNKIDSDEAKRLFEEDDELLGLLDDLAVALGYETALDTIRNGRSSFEVSKILMAQYVRVRSVFVCLESGEVTNARWAVRLKDRATET